MNKLETLHISQKMILVATPTGKFLKLIFKWTERVDVTLCNYYSVKVSTKDTRGRAVLKLQGSDIKVKLMATLRRAV